MLEIVTSIRVIDKSNLDCGVLFHIQLITFGADEMKAYSAKLYRILTDYQTSIKPK